MGSRRGAGGRGKKITEPEKNVIGSDGSRIVVSLWLLLLLTGNTLFRPFFRIYVIDRSAPYRESSVLTHTAVCVTGNSWRMRFHRGHRKREEIKFAPLHRSRYFRLFECGAAIADNHQEGAEKPLRSKRADARSLLDKRWEFNENMISDFRWLAWDRCCVCVSVDRSARRTHARPRQLPERPGEINLHELETKMRN